MAEQDYYGILGVSKKATEDEIKTAYRNLAKRHHPDLHSNASEADKKANEEKFKKVSHAYDVLSDKQKRETYDRYGNEDGPVAGGGGGGFSGFSGFGGGGGFEDIFSSIFDSFGGGSSSRRKPTATRDGADIGVQLTIEFDEAAFGCTKEISINRTENCTTCNGTGAKTASGYKTCGKCHGTGYVNYQKSTIFGTVMEQAVCDLCDGTGKIITDKCTSCNGQGYKKVTHIHKVVIPAGIDNGQKMTYHGEGNCGLRGGKKGSLHVLIRVKPHKYFERRGTDLSVNIPVSFVTAAVGGDIDIPTLEGVIKYKIPSGTVSGEIFKLKGRGIKFLRRDAKGDLYVKVDVETPVKLTLKQKEMLNKFQKSLSSSQEPKRKKFYK